MKDTSYSNNSFFYVCMGVCLFVCVCVCVCERERDNMLLQSFVLSVQKYESVGSFSAQIGNTRDH